MPQPFVPNEIRESAKILLVGESPGDEECINGKPFVGSAGDILWSTLSRHGIRRENCSIANLFNEQPPGNSFKWIEENRLPQLQLNVSNLLDHIDRSNYNLVICLGGAPARWLTRRGPVSAWRGSVFQERKKDQKFAISFHPSYILRDATKLPIFDIDLEKFVRESRTSLYEVRKRTYNVDRRSGLFGQWFEELSASPRFTVDIESSKKTHKILCVGFANSPTNSYCFPWDDFAARQYIQSLLENDAEKILHFGTFDTLMLQREGIEVNKYLHDTMVLQHVLWPRFPRSLAYLTSVYTDLPYYKQTGKDEIPDDDKSWSDKVDRDTLAVYNCKDCCATFECFEKMYPELEELGLTSIYEQEMQQVAVAREISNNGFAVNIDLRDKMLVSAKLKWDSLQAVLDVIIGETVNVKSPKLPHILHSKLGVPYRKNRKGGVTADEDAIISLMTWAQEKKEESKLAGTKAKYELKVTALKLIIEIREQRQLISNYLTPELSPDNRCRSVYKVASTDFSRWAAEGFIDGTGLNSQTFPRGSIVLADSAESAAVVRDKLKAIFVGDNEVEET